MGKTTEKELGPDDPIFSEGVTITPVSRNSGKEHEEMKNFIRIPKLELDPKDKKIFTIKIGRKNEGLHLRCDKLDNFEEHSEHYGMYRLLDESERDAVPTYYHSEEEAWKKAVEIAGSYYGPSEFEGIVYF